MRPMRSATALKKEARKKAGSRSKPGGVQPGLKYELEIPGQESPSKSGKRYSTRSSPPKRLERARGRGWPLPDPSLWISTRAASTSNQCWVKVPRSLSVSLTRSRLCRWRGRLRERASQRLRTEPDGCAEQLIFGVAVEFAIFF